MKTKHDRSILVVDDEELIRKTLSRKLTKEGYNVECAKDGRVAKKYIESKNFDLVITDIVMHDTDGFEVLNHTKTVSPDTIVIVITGYASVDSAVLALRQGAYDYLIKPCDNEEVLMRIEKALEKKDILEQLRESEKRLAMSQLAVAVNHEINSPLTVMIGNTELLMCHKNELCKENCQCLEKIIEAGNKIKAIVSRLRDIKDAPVIQYASDETMIDLKTTLEQSAPDSATKPVILIADDEELILDLFQTILGDKYNLICAVNGNVAIDLTKKTYNNEQKIDIVFLDLHMPEKNGLETFRELKKLDPDIKVVLITGYINDELIKQAMDEGAMGYLYKPFKVADIFKTIHDILQYAPHK